MLYIDKYIIVYDIYDNNTNVYECESVRGIIVCDDYNDNGCNVKGAG